MKTFFKSNSCVHCINGNPGFFLANSWLEDYVNTLSGFNEIVPFIFIPPVLVSVIYLVKNKQRQLIKNYLMNK